MHYLPTPLIGKDHISHNNSAHGQEAQAKIKELLFNRIVTTHHLEIVPTHTSHNKSAQGQGSLKKVLGKDDLDRLLKI